VYVPPLPSPPAWWTVVVERLCLQPTPKRIRNTGWLNRTSEKDRDSIYWLASSSHWSKPTDRTHRRSGTQNSDSRKRSCKKHVFHFWLPFISGIFDFSPYILLRHLPVWTEITPKYYIL